MYPAAVDSVAVTFSFQRITYDRSDTSGRTASTTTAVSRRVIAMRPSAKHRTLWPRWDRPSTTAARGGQSPPADETPSTNILFLLVATDIRPTDVDSPILATASFGYGAASGSRAVHRRSASRPTARAQSR